MRISDWSSDVCSSDLNCIGIQQGDEAYGVWRLTTEQGGERTTEVVRVHGTLSTNDGETAVNWALDGHGILMRAAWAISRYRSEERRIGKECVSKCRSRL